MKLSKSEVLILAIILAAFEAVQLNVSMSLQAHAVLTMAIIVLSGAGIHAISKVSFLAILPAHLAVLVSSILGAVIVLEGSFSISSRMRAFSAAGISSSRACAIAG